MHTGTLRDVEEGKTDFVFATRLFMNLGTKNCGYLTPVDLVNLKYVTRKRSKKEKLLNFHVLQAFDIKSRQIYAFTILCLVSSWHLINKLKKKLVKTKNDIRFFSLVFTVISIQSSVSASIKKFNSFHHRIFIAVLLISALILCNSFQGSIVSNLSSPPKSTDINTLEELIAKNVQLSAMVLIPNLFKPNRDASNVNEIQKKIYARQIPNLELDFEKIKKIDEKNAFLSNMQFRIIHIYKEHFCKFQCVKLLH